MKPRLPDPMVTMADIAKKACVSRSTASFVLNNRQAEMRISDETRQRVLDAARDLGYRRNELARAVGSGKNYVLGFVKMGAVEQEAQLMEGVLKATAEADYLLKVLPGDETLYQGVAHRCVEQRLAGVVTRSFREAAATTAFLEELEAYGIPVVFVDDDLAIPGTSCVTSDDEHGYRLTVEHLAGLGHRRIAFLAGDSVHPQSVFRKESYRRRMAECGLSVPEGSVLDTDWEVARCELLTRQLFENQSHPPTALICAGDKLAAVALRTLWRLGLRVPEDVSVIGYSDFSFAALLNPALTTISQPFEEMGAVATRILLKRLQNPANAEELPSRVVLPTQLIVRESTSVAPVRPVGKIISPPP
jgi:LacI family transcriptional regulator